MSILRSLFQAFRDYAFKEKRFVISRQTLPPQFQHTEFTGRFYG